MTDADNLDQLSARELHDLAVHRALRHVDVKFLWDLLRELPAAEAGAGRTDLATADALHLSELIGDAIDSGEGQVAESMRPFYASYLRQHEASQGQGPSGH
ncbi:MAG: hypothetical protein M3Y33_14375 [Actinomycetota bacterium]|nr:hypothetical protein [Actinomycetota bacterium]